MDKARREEIVRWGLGVFLAVGLHVGAAFGVIVWNATRTPPLSPPPAMMIELAAVPVAPPPQPNNAPPEPKQEKVEPPPPEPEPEPLPEKVEPPPPPKPKVKPEVALPKPPPPKPRPKQPQQPQPIEEKTPPPEPVSKPPAPAEQSPPAPKAKAPAPSASSAQVRKTVQTWQQLLLAHIERHKRYPSSARRRRQEGVTYLRFVMDREGQVLSARIERSSGYTLLDKETQALIERAAPLPVPPPEISGKQLEFVVPVQFFIR
ncbi:TonB family protein [Nitrosococcus halophilus Nc 4]|uniref:TonB family protein n=2 Tax=Nitrosococcus halophilus TaxID=133539 RepID=D5C326_NITHN|nr:TonB family protein [Nitrosococcus halophilus Nc 4]